ncbi:hypothetical protein CFC21_089901 [Triticum aestivum]|uniref:F-box domain-containing protein n=3 Tax=Triticum TaxID=4564 RepID=A0A9R1BF76_TRITD|nr:hypothetical protein CFC21_089901 [Triticum aestivum]VAI62401.1 unnamed protein product [Triticum turgidum subsp. durum]
MDEMAAPQPEAVSLPEDAVREILVRVEGTAALFRCAVTCKSWSRLVADASFLRRRWPDDHGASRFLARFLAPKRLDRTDPNFRTGEPMFATFLVPTPRSVFTRRSLGSFFPDADTCLLDGMEPLTARHGLLLVRLFPDVSAGYKHDKSVVNLVVCNLLTRVCEVLPPLCGHLNFTKSGYAILTSAECSSSAEQQSLQSTFFKVLIIGTMKFGPPSLYTFSSSDSRWSKPIKLTFDTAGGIRDSKHPDTIVSRGKVHWSVRNWYPDYSLDMDMKTFHISQTMIMDRTTYSETNKDPQLAVTADGMPLVLLLSRPGLELKICTRQDEKKSDDGAIVKAGWLTTRTVELKPPRQIKRRPEKIYMRLLGEKSGTMLLKDSQRQIYIADLETGVMEQFELPDGFDGLNRQKVVLLEMDWPALFISWLGKW